MNANLYLGLALIAVGLAELTWVVRTRAARHFAAQSMMFGELGLMFVALAVIPSETVAAVVVAMLGLGALVSGWIYVKLVRQLKRNVDASD